MTSGFGSLSIELVSVTFDTIPTSTSFFKEKDFSLVSFRSAKAQHRACLHEDTVL